MKFNVSKCHSMRVTRLHPSSHIEFNYTLHQQTLEQVQSAKYLGLTITDDLDWGQHISEITCKATKTLGFLWRNLALAPRHTKEVAYKTLVRPQLEYAAPIWHPYNETQTAKVEKVQRTAARWTCRRWRNTSSVGEMLDELEWTSLESRREQSSLTFFYKKHSGTVSLDKDKYLTPAPNLKLVSHWHANSSRLLREFSRGTFARHSCECRENFHVSRTSRELVAKVLNMFKNWMRIFFPTYFARLSRDGRTTFVRMSRTCRREILANLQCEIFATLVRMSCECRTTVARQS